MVSDGGKRASYYTYGACLRSENDGEDYGEGMFPTVRTWSAHDTAYRGMVLFARAEYAIDSPGFEWRIIYTPRQVFLCS